MEKKKLRVSYSLLQCWKQGRVDEAVNLYLRRPTFVSEPMRIGREIHENIAKHIELKSQLPTWLMNHPLTKPLCEHKLIVSYNELFDLSVVIDCLDAPTLFEFKTGGVESNEWAHTLQIPLYFLACNIARIEVEKAFLVHYNQDRQKSDWTMVWNSNKAILEASNLIDTIGPEILDYFIKNKIELDKI